MQPKLVPPTAPAVVPRRFGVCEFCDTAAAIGVLRIARAPIKTIAICRGCALDSLARLRHSVGEEGNAEPDRT